MAQFNPEDRGQQNPISASGEQRPRRAQGNVLEVFTSRKGTAAHRKLQLGAEGSI